LNAFARLAAHVLAGAVLCFAGSAAHAQSLVLVSEGESRYRIVVPSTPTDSEEKAANVLQDHLLQISGAAIPIVTADRPAIPYEIVIGQNERLDELGITVDFNALEEDGFAIRTADTRLVIAGGSEKGVLNGVYTFLEDQLGARLYSPSVKILPNNATITLGVIDDVQVPAMTFRTTHYRTAWDAEYVDWHKLDHDAEGERPDWGLWVHTFNRLVPPATYYEEHPEYYALVDGKRIPTQLCLTNPDVLSITVQNLRREIAKNPDATYWSVSQNDNREYCRCDRCRALDEREGSPSGSIISFVNQVAEHFPDRVISTLAYEYSRKAPRTLRPAGNVNIMLCSIEVNRDRPIATDPASADFRHDVEEWSEIADDIIVWDYVIQFRNLVSPFPNLHVLKPNIRFFADHGVTAMFEQGNREVGGEFAELRAYLISKLMWNPDADVDALTDDFLHGYYGVAAPHIRQYIDEMREALLASGEPLRIFGSPVEAASSYLTPALLDRYEELFDAAEAAVTGDDEVLERVRVARLPVEFAIMEQAKAGPTGLFEQVDGRWTVREDIRSRVDPFTDLSNRIGITRLKEWSTPPEEYRSAMYRLLSQGMDEHLASGKTVTGPSTGTASGADIDYAMLTDGKRGSHDYTYDWLHTSGIDIDVTIDLESAQTVRRIESAFYQHSAAHMLLPAKVDFFVSMDGSSFGLVGSASHTLPIDQYGAIQRDFVAEFEPREARFVRMTAHSIGNTPDTHPGAGRPARMLVDEVVVE
jgi:hypothetical protein